MQDDWFVCEKTHYTVEDFSGTASGKMVSIETLTSPIRGEKFVSVNLLPVEVLREDKENKENERIKQRIEAEIFVANFQKKMIYQNYQKYLQSTKWKTRRANFFGKECVAECGSPGGELHHMSYGLLGREGKKHVMWLCRNCHQTLHDWNGTQKIKLKKMKMLLKQLQKQNRLKDLKPAVKYKLF